MLNSLAQKVTFFLRGFSVSFLILVIADILIRLFELIYIHSTGFAGIDADAFFSGLNFDLFFWTALHIVLLIPFSALSALAPRLSLLLYRSICAVFLLASIGLTHFFLTNNYLLSNEILFFSLNDMATVVSAEMSLSRLTLWSLYLLVPLVVFFQFYFTIKKPISVKGIRGILITFALISLSVLINVTSYEKDISHFASKYNYYLGNNKITYLGHSILNFMETERSAQFSDKDIEESIREFHNRNKLKYVSMRYPLSREDDLENVLGPYFKTSAKKPNIVLIISESLSSAFSGKYANLGNLTPFLDSLMKQGLYWRNFISNAERSYGALPNILASLPYGGHRGFLGLYNAQEGMPYPDHNSLIKVLKQNNYVTSFYYGGWGFFDHMGNFLEFNGIDHIYSDYTFDKTRYDRLSGTDDGFKWGYNDKDLFAHVLEETARQPKDTPYLSVITTISLHTPYNMCTRNYYNAGYISQRLKQMGADRDLLVSNFKQVPKAQIDSYGLDEKITKKIAENVLASIFFVDDAMRDFFEAYRKRADYANTIFIITGDHNIGTLPLKNELDNYRVPLVIFSPLLSQPKEFKAVSSHIDILPSLLSLLNKNYKLQVPLQYQWMGLGLDTASYYRNRSEYALSLYNDNFPNFFYKDYLVSSNEVYRVKENLELEKTPDAYIKDSVLKIMKNYRMINRYVCEKNAITNNEAWWHKSVVQ